MKFQITVIARLRAQKYTCTAGTLRESEINKINKLERYPMFVNELNARKLGKIWFTFHAFLD